jgi:hypothetical protein
MSALPPKADIAERHRDVRLSSLMHRSKRVLFDHLVGQGEQFIWDSQAKCLGGGEIND